MSDQQSPTTELTSAADRAFWKIVDAAKAANVEYSCLSWGGFNLLGDHDSIGEVRRLMACEARLMALEARINGKQ